MAIPERKSIRFRTLPKRLDLGQLRRQAKELLHAFTNEDPHAVAEVNAHYSGADRRSFALHDAQLVLARAYGFSSWPKLKEHIDGVTVRHFEGIVRAGNVSRVKSMLKARPQLVSGGALHYAVLQRSAEMVRALMEHGGNARAGVYPHRDATSPLTLATERGYQDIAAIIRQEEQRRQERSSGRNAAPSPDTLLQAIASGEEERAISMMDADPDLIRTCNGDGLTALHVASRKLNLRLVTWLLDHGANPKAVAKYDWTPLDVAAQWSEHESFAQFLPVAALLRERGAILTARAAVALGEADWLRARHAESILINRIHDSGGLLRIAASHNRPEILAMLLDFGFDPDERTRYEQAGADDVVFTWGMPLYHCAGSSKYAMAEMLLRRGADPNGKVYASGDPVFEAYHKRDWKMVELLKRYGGKAEATTAGLFRQTALAKQMLAGEAEYGLEGVGGDTLAEQLLWGAACGGDPEIVRMALERVERPPGDQWWFHILEQPLRIWNHSSQMRSNPEWDRGAYLTCFSLILARCDPNLQGRVADHGRFGLTILHSVAGSRDHVSPEERVGFATLLLNAGARLDIRDNLLKSTPLGWACRWGRIELVELFLQRGADPAETDAEPWATPRAWAERMGHAAVVALLR